MSCKRLTDNKKSDLIFDPIGYDDWSWYAKNNKNELKKLISTKYVINRQITYNMPKSSLTYRPITYLLPSDSIIYQSIVDRIIEYRRSKFSKQVYSNIILDINKSEVFDKPVIHWLEMRKNIRKMVRNGNNYYLFSDIASCFENVKISKLINILEFYVGKNEYKYIEILDRILTKWQFAEAQGIIQPHTASSILCKIYLTSVDSSFAFIGKCYHRYVDEFHILSDNKKDIHRYSLRLALSLRDLGMNLNSSKNKILFGEDEIIEAVSEDNDFFEAVNYITKVLKDYKKSDYLIDRKFDQFVTDYLSGNDVNMKIFRYCIRKYANDRNDRSVRFCLSIIDSNYEQIVDIVKYLSVFINDLNNSQIIIKEIFLYLKDPNRNIHSWVQIWFLALILKVDNSLLIDFKYVYSIALNKNYDDLSRSISFLILAKHFEDHDLQFIVDAYRSENSIILKRSLLFCCSKLPKAVRIKLLKIEEDDPIDIIVTKKYLQENEYKIQSII